MLTAQDIREWMERVMMSHDLTPASWAQRANVNKSTIYRAIKPGYAFVTSTRTLRQLAEAIGETLPGVDLPIKEAATFLAIRGEVGAGVWRAVNELQDEPLGSGPVLSDPAYAQFPQWLERVIGDSMNLEYVEGSLLHVIDTIALGYAPRAGDHVIVERTRQEGGVVERTVKEVAFSATGLQLIARSSNPRWANHPVVVTPRGKDLDHCTVQIVGLVLGSYRSRRPI